MMVLYSTGSELNQRYAESTGNDGFSGNNIPLEAIRQQIASAINIIIQLSRLRDKSRRTVEITEVVGYENGEFQLNTLYKFVEHGEDKNGRIIGGLERTDPMVNTFKFKMAGISDKV